MTIPDHTTITYTLPSGEMVSLDSDDADLLAFKWSNNGAGYAYRHLPRPNHRKPIYMHVEILARMIGRAPVKGEFCDHKDLNPFNNRRENLRLATRQEQQRNQPYRGSKSGYKGVRWHVAGNGWAASITVDGKQKHLGLFATPELAHKAYCEAAAKYFGEFARCE